MPKKSKLTKAVKDDIVKRRLQGKTLAEIGREFGIGTSTVQYVVDTHIGDVTSEKPDFPAAISDFETAIHAALTCKDLGFDSEITASVCKKYQCSVDELKSLCTWYAVNGDNLHKSLENRLAFRNKQLSKANKDIKTYKGELDAVNKLYADLKLKNKQAEAAVSLLKKSLGGCLGKATTFEVEPGTRQVIVDSIAETCDSGLSVKQRCSIVGISNTLYYKWKKDVNCKDHRAKGVPKKRRKQTVNPRADLAITADEEKLIIEHLTAPENAEFTIDEIVDNLLAEGIAIASPRTYRRIAKKHNLRKKERKALKKMRAKGIPTRLGHVATRPNSLWAWDIWDLLLFKF